MSALIRRSWIPPTVMEGEATAEGAVAKVSRVRYSLPRSYAWVRTDDDPFIVLTETKFNQRVQRGGS